ncbi:MAG: hypothetical protein Q7T56_12730 [Nocardioidaceae bacterium]|nr:hypothetical protein [Nocardioidaceae bacterium]
MAKALLGYVAADNPHLTRELAVLRRRVVDLETEVLRLKSENDALHSSLTDNLSTADLLEPAAG